MLDSYQIYMCTPTSRGAYGNIEGKRYEYGATVVRYRNKSEQRRILYFSKQALGPGQVYFFSKKFRLCFLNKLAQILISRNSSSSFSTQSNENYQFAYPNTIHDYSWKNMQVGLSPTLESQG